MTTKLTNVRSACLMFKVLFIVVFIQYGLINQQQVACRSRGLIYNKDGKFIYKPPKSNQGHIIVIEERPRDPMMELNPKSASTVFQPAIQLISPRAYQPGPSQLDSPYRGLYSAAAINPGQVQLISLNDLSRPLMVKHPHSGNLRQDSTLIHPSSHHQPAAVQIIPLIQLVPAQASRFPRPDAEYGVQHNQVSGPSQEYDPDPPQSPPRQRSFYDSVARPSNQLYDSEPYVDTYEEAPVFNHRPSATYSEQPSPSRFSAMASEFSTSPFIDNFDDTSSVNQDLYSESVHSRSSIENSTSSSRLAPSASLVGPFRINPIPGLHRAPSVRQIEPKVRHNLDTSIKVLKPLRKSQQSNKSRAPPETLRLTDHQNTHHHNNDQVEEHRGPKGEVYWKQFKNHFDIIN